MRAISGEIKTSTDGYERQSLSVMITKHRKHYGKSV